VPRLGDVEELEELVDPLGTTKILLFSDGEVVAEVSIRKEWNRERQRYEYKVVLEDYTAVPPSRKRAWCEDLDCVVRRVGKLLDEWEWEYDEAWVARCPWEEREAAWGELVEVEKEPLRGGACITEVRGHVEVEVCASLEPDGSAYIEAVEREPYRLPRRVKEVRVYGGGRAKRVYHELGREDFRGELVGEVYIEEEARTPLSPVEALRRVFGALADNYRRLGQYYTPSVFEELEELLQLEKVKGRREEGEEEYGGEW
jgi:hypothetical protein